MANRFKSENDLIRNRLYNISQKRYTYLCDLEIEGWRTKEPVCYDDRQSGEYFSIKVGESWGEHWDCAWFHLTGKVPDEAKGKNVILRVDFSGEGCVFDNDGVPVQGLTLGGRYSTWETLGIEDKTIIDVCENAKGGEEIDVWIDAGCNNLGGSYIDSGKFVMASVNILDTELNQLYFDFQVLKLLMEQLPEDKAQRHSIFNSLLKSCYELQRYSQEEAIKARNILKKELDKKGGDPSLSLTVIGHAHVDLAWLWPLREGKRKAVRTFASALNYMEKYPDYCLGQSQPQQYKWMKEEYPCFYEKIKQKIKEGRIEPQGALWVEPDTNVPGGEALIRQVLYGKRFYKKEFDKDVKVAWLPDVFGFNAQLPQILAKSGVDYFVTVKLSWSKMNNFPYHTFNWQGIDGSRVLAHMPPEAAFATRGEPGTFAAAERNFRDKGISDEALIYYGVCDGGGGPGEGHLESIKRIKNINGLLPLKQEHSIDFFERINEHKSDFATWHGELYLEFHQGTLTTQARNKLYNRKMELALRELEFAGQMADVLCGYDYPKDKLDEIWEEVLLYQFHDILPGSSIKRVYDESLQRYAIMHAEVLELTQKAYENLLPELITVSGDKSAAIFNSLSWERTQWININSEWVKVTLPPMGYALVEPKAESFSEIFGDILVAKNGCLENQYLKVEINKEGHIASVYSKAFGDSRDKEMIVPGHAANKMVIYNDPGDAWDFSMQYTNELIGEFKLDNAEYYINGPEATAELDFSYGNSVMKQKIVLKEGAAQVEINCFVDWQETEKMLRAEIPVNVNSDEVKCNIQFGNVTRPTHKSSSWDYAKYEVCAHKWIDISNKSYGVAILNDSKYGYGVIGNNISINLLRSTMRPGVDADKGVHVFAYAIYPHFGAYTAEIDRVAYEFNIKPFVCDIDKNLSKSISKLPDKSSFFKLLSLMSGSVMAETVKQAEDSRDTIIRLYEYEGAETNSFIIFDEKYPVKSVWLTDLMEKEIKELEIQESDMFDGKSVEIHFDPFEIQTIKLIHK